MTEDFQVVVKTKMLKKDLGKIVEKIKSKQKLTTTYFNKADENLKTTPHWFVFFKDKKGTPYDLSFYFYDTYATEELTDEVTAIITLEDKFADKFNDFLSFILDVCRIMGAELFYGGYTEPTLPKIIGVNKNGGMSDFRTHLLTYGTKYRDITTVPSEKKLVELFEKHSAEKETVKGYKIYYLYPKKLIWSLRDPLFYKMLQANG